VFKLGEGKAAVCGIAVLCSVVGTCLAVWPRQLTGLEGGNAGGPPTAAQIWGVRAEPDPETVLF
jgi:hypothetical protein